MFARFINLRMVALLALVLVLSAVAYGFAAANNVDPSSAGDGQAAISGYTVTNIRYTLDPANPVNLSAVSFTVTPATAAQKPTSVYVKLVDTGTTYTSCTNPSGDNWTCSVTGVTAAQANQLRVIAAQ